MEEKIIGYDVREMWFTDERDFIKDGRFQKVLSIDASIWGSIFKPAIIQILLEKSGKNTA